MTMAGSRHAHGGDAGSAPLRVLTYNIHKGIGGIDRRYRLERILEVLRAYKADILFLQEVDDGVPRSGRDCQVDVIGDALAMPFRAFQANVSLTVGCYGNAILSRYPLSFVHNLDLSVRLKKRRRALLASCRAAADSRHDVLLLNCHLGLAAYERRAQVNTIIRHLTETRRTDIAATIAGGDLNDSWRALGKPLLGPAGYATTASQAPTFPAVLPLRKLDHLCHAGAMECLHSFVGHSQLARQASDHLPLIADFRFINVPGRPQR